MRPRPLIFARWALVLEPLDPKVRRIIASIRAEGAADAVRSVELRLADGDRSVLTIVDATRQ